MCPADRPDLPALIVRRLESFVRDGVVRVATGPVAPGPSAIRESFVRARFALLAAARTGQSGAIAFTDLGAVALLSLVPSADLKVFVGSTLGPVLERPELMTTLREWFRSGGSWRAVALATSIHRNSVGHRIERIRSLLGVDPADPVAGFELQLAMAGLDVLRAARNPD